MEKEIRLAFSGVSREGGVSLSEAREIDNYGSEKARREARKRDTDTRWEDIPDESIPENCELWPFLDEIGFHYYIPAFISWCVRKRAENELGYEDPWYPTVDFFTLCALDISPAEAKRQLKNFTPEQLVATAHFLQFLEKEEIQANEQLWKRERKEWRQGMQKDTNLSEQEIDAMEEETKRNYMNSYSVDKAIGKALKRCWGQFIEE